MKRLQLIEIEDQAWCPGTIRDTITDYLQFVSSAIRPYTPVAPVLASAIRRAGTQNIVDLCSGAAGPWPWLHPALAELGLNLSVCLTDKFPNLGALNHHDRQLRQPIHYHPQPVDARQVPDELNGFRTMFTAFHHFHPQDAQAVLADAVRKRQGMAVFEATQRRAPALMFMILVVPLMLLIVTPLIRPFRWSRLFWTYLVPLAPLVLLFDALVSCLRTYTIEELQALAAGTGAGGYRWETGSLKEKGALTRITYLIGLPSDGSDSGNQDPGRSN